MTMRRVDEGLPGGVSGAGGGAAGLVGAVSVPAVTTTVLVASFAVSLAWIVPFALNVTFDDDGASAVIDVVKPALLLPNVVARARAVMTVSALTVGIV